MRDRLFAVRKKQTPFKFDERVTQVFDDMLERSVPCYREVQGHILSLIQFARPPAKHIVDLGCSTGNLLFFLAQGLNRPTIRYAGCDSSRFMIEKARENLKTRRLKGRFVFTTGDIRDFPCADADVVILNYVLQFLGLGDRQRFLQKLHHQLKPGCLLIVSDKTSSPAPIFAKSFSRIHEEFKLSKSYSKLEISQKRKALENVLIPVSFTEHQQMIRNSGFAHVEPFFTWFNFASFVAMK